MLSGGRILLQRHKETLIHSHAAVKVHPVNPNRRVILDAQIDMFADPEPKVARLREISFPQLVLLDLQSSLQDLFRLRAPNGDVHGDLFVTTDPERSDGVPCFAFVRDVLSAHYLAGVDFRFRQLQKPVYGL